MRLTIYSAMSVKVALVGLGGIGSVTTLALESGKKAKVTVVARSTYNTLREKGLTYDSVDYGHIENWYPFKIVKSVEEAAEHGPYDYIAVCTKNIPEVIKTEDLIKPLVTPGCAIVLIQNGYGNENPVMGAFPDCHVIGGVTQAGAKMFDGYVRQNNADNVFFGTLDPRKEAKAALERWVDVYNAGGKSNAQIDSNLPRRRWCKLIYNTTFNCISTVTGLDTGRLYFSGLDDDLIVPAMAELRAIAEADLGGERLPENIEKDMLYDDDGDYYAPSMLHDLRNGRPMEIECILGNPVRCARRLGVSAPILSVVYKLIRGKQFGILESAGKISVPEKWSMDLDKPIDW